MHQKFQHIRACAGTHMAYNENTQCDQIEKNKHFQGCSWLELQCLACSWIQIYLKNDIVNAVTPATTTTAPVMITKSDQQLTDSGDK